MCYFFLVFPFLELGPQKIPPEADTAADLHGKVCRSSLGVSGRSVGAQFLQLLHFGAISDEMPFLLAKMADAGFSLLARFP